LSNEDQQRLESLGNLTASVDAENPTPEQQQAQDKEQAQQAAIDQGAHEWAMLMMTIGGFAAMIEPTISQVYTQEACEKWGVSANEVAQKYGFTGGVVTSPEFSLIVSTAGLAIPTYIIIKAKMNEAANGGEPKSLLARIGLWWRTRKARAAMQARGVEAMVAEQAAQHGSQ
jgi:hypothetical protein